MHVRIYHLKKPRLQTRYNEKWHVSKIALYTCIL